MSEILLIVQIISGLGLAGIAIKFILKGTK
jgi:hypothetical protein